MLEIKHPDKKQDQKYGTEIKIPADSPLIGMKLGELENLLNIKVHHYHTYRQSRGGYSHRIFENIGEHKIESLDMIKYFGGELHYISTINEEIESGGGLNQLRFIAKSQNRQSPSSGQ